MKKTKQYTSFNFPNSLTAFEQYFHYLLEFDVIPKTIHPRKLERIFLTVSKDFLDGFLDFNTFSFIVDNLYIKYVVFSVGVDNKIEKFMEDLSENDELGDKDIRERLEIFKLQ